MKELVLGKIKTKELADWFGIAYSTFRKNSQKRLEELEYFCVFTRYRGGVEVSEIIFKQYIKNLASKDSEVYLQLVKESNDCLCSLAGMARKLIYLYPETWGKYSESQISKRLKKVGEAMFGKTNLPVYREDQEEKYSGPYGYKEYCWAIKIDNLNKYRFLTDEEHEKFKILLDSYNINKEDIAMKELYDKQKRNELKNGNITIEDYCLAMEHSELFPNLLSKFKEITGKTLVRATYHDILESAYK